ncbi:glycosyltransferase family 4 protein [Streptomyces sp. NPDC059373]
MRAMLDACGAEIVPIPDSRGLTESVRGCESLCQLVAEQATLIAHPSGPCLLIGLDVPFLGLAPYLPDDVDLLLVPRSTAMLAHREDHSRIRWERAGLASAAARGSRIAAISQHMRWHLGQEYGVPRRALLDLTNGLLLDEEAVQTSSVLPLPVRAQAGFLLAMGRAVPEKGFEDLLFALALLRGQGIRVPHLVLAATSTAPQGNAYQSLLAEIIRESPVDATLVTRFTPAVRSWLLSPALRAVIVPSREEPFGRIPLEAFAAKAGPVVASRAGGLAQTVLDGVTGFTAAPGDPEGLAAAIHRALTALPREREQLENAGSALLAARHDYLATIRTALTECAPWAMASTAREGGEPR